MWGFYYHIIDCYVVQENIIENPAQASVPLINYMVKAHQYFDQSINGKESPLEKIFGFIAKTFNDGAENGDEIHSMCGVTLIMALIEHITEKNVLSSQMDTINQFYLQEMERADTRAYKHMIIQGIMMNFLYDQQSTASYLIGRQKLDEVF